MSRRLVVAVSLLAVGALPVVAAPTEVASAKTKKATTPKVKRTTPMRVKVGKKITLRGTGFSSKRTRNTVIFRSPAGRYAFAKPSRSSGRKLVVKVPASVERLLLKANGTRPAARFKLRVVVKKRRSKLTAKRISPILTSSLRDKNSPAAACGRGDDWDGDGLTNAREQSLRLDPCTRDTDRDGAEDGFEVESSLHLNPNAKPSTAKRPFPNALDPGDAGVDYDGDGLTLREEFQAWAHADQGPGGILQGYSSAPQAPIFGGPYGGRPAFGGHRFPLNYSDGRQATLDIRAGHPEFGTHLDTDGDGFLTDDERDADGDGLGNAEELRGLMVPAYYPPGECSDPATTNDYTYRPLLPHGMTAVNWLDSDSDGDGVWDGNDDQDNDNVSNVDEILPPYQDCSPSAPGVFTRGPVDRARDGVSSTLRSPYNPCLPVRSDTCARYTGG